MIQDEALGRCDVRHGFFTRQGGVSTGLYASRNCGLGSRDEPDHVRANRAAAAAALGAGRLCTPYQVHGTNVVPLTDTPDPDRWEAARPQADALVTNVPGLAIGIVTADCAPILLADPVAGVIGAAHAGWKGALAGVAEATIAAMQALGAAPARIAAAIGPCIALASYEVGPEFQARFVAEDAAATRFFAVPPGAARAHFDLPAYVAARLARAGVAATAPGHDTAAEPALFFSYRRATLAGEPDYGRQLSALAL